MAWALQQEGRYPEAERSERDILNTERRVLGAEHPDTLSSMSDLAWILHQEGRYIEAEKIERETLDIQRRVLGPDHPDTLSDVGHLALTLQKERRNAEAERLLREMLDIQRHERPEHPQTLQTISLLASTLEHEGRYDEAGKLLRDMLEIQRRVLGTDNPTTSLTIYNLACDAARSGDPLDALALLNEAVDRQLPVDVLLGFDKDAGLKFLHGDPNFTAVVARARLKAATVQHSK